MKRTLSMLLLSLLLSGGIVLTAGCSKEDPASPTNHAPTITSLTSSVSNVHFGEQTTITCDASDSDEDSLIYEWNASDGTIEVMGDGASVVWTLPLDVPSAMIEVTVSDGEASVQDSLRLVPQYLDEQISLFLDDGEVYPKALTQASNGDVYVLANVGSGIAQEFRIYSFPTDTRQNWAIEWSPGTPHLAYDIIPRSAGGVFVAGDCYEADQSTQACVAAVDQAGTIVWEMTYGGVGMDDARRLAEGEDGRLYVLGTTSLQGGTSQHVMLQCYTSEGDLAYSMVFDENSTEGYVDNGGLIPLPNGSCLVGYNRHTDFRDDAVLALVDATGNLVHDDSYTYLEDRIRVVGLLKRHFMATDYVLVTQIDETDITHLLNLFVDSDGFIAEPAMVTLPSGFHIADATLSSDNHLLLAGEIPETGTEGSTDLTDSYLMKIDIFGSTIWEHRFDSGDSENFSDVIQARNGGINLVETRVHPDTGDRLGVLVRLNHFGH